MQWRHVWPNCDVRLIDEAARQLSSVHVFTYFADNTDTRRRLEQTRGAASHSHVLLRRCRPLVSRLAARDFQSTRADLLDADLRRGAVWFHHGVDAHIHVLAAVGAPRATAASGHQRRCVHPHLQRADRPLVRKTVLAAMAMDTPHRHLDSRRWASAGGNESSGDRKLGCEYLARTDNADAKAGQISLNNALANSRGELIAVFDADHTAPRRDFLEEDARLFRRCTRVAFVQTPQVLLQPGLVPASRVRYIA